MYRVVVAEEAQGSVAALPFDAVVALADAFALMEIAPWSGPPQNAANPEGAVRRLIFGPAGAGQVAYLILESTREVHVLVVLWLGA